jgi:hypothetical protein
MRLTSPSRAFVIAGCALAVALARAAAAQQPVAPTTQVVATPPDFPRGKISGYVFGDWYYDVQGSPDHGYVNGADTLDTNIDASTSRLIGRDLNGIQIRRVYFQLDNDLSARYATRFRLEADSKALTSDGKIGVFVKAAYLQAKSVLPRNDVYVGMVATPAFENSEEFWQYRSVEKTVTDFRGLSASSDLGLLLKGAVDPDHRVSYVVMLGDGNGQKPETDRYKKASFAVPLRWGDLRLEPYADYEWAAARADKATYKVFAGYELPRNSAVGVEWVDRVTHRTGAPNQEPRALSVFARTMPTPRFGAFARVDAWDPDARADQKVTATLIIAGLDWQPYKDVHVMPNVEAMQYAAKGGAAAPSHDETQFRLTFYYRFSKPQS